MMSMTNQYISSGNMTDRVNVRDEDCHLLFYRVVLLDVCLDLLHDWPVLNLGEGFGVTDWSSS